jgi:hypothetical protein
LIEAKNINDVASSVNSRRRGWYGNSKYHQIDGVPADYGLFVPAPFVNDTPTMKVEIDSSIDDTLLNKLKKLEFNYPLVVVGEDYNELLSDSKFYYYKMYCPICNKFYRPLDTSDNIYTLRCPQCSKNVKMNRTYGFSSKSIIVLKNFKEYRKKNFDSKIYDVFNDFKNSINKTFYYLCKHPQNQNGIIIYRIIHSYIAEKNSIIDKWSIDSQIEHIVGQKMVAYKHLKSGIKEVDPFEVLNINSKNITNIPDIIYEDSEDFYDFAYKNEKFLKMSGFLSALKFSSQKLSLPSFFILFIGLVNKYPILEQIIKMGHAKLFFNLYDELTNSLSKDMILAHIEKLNGIINTESKGGKDALRFPIYIGEYLIQKNASLEEYYYWRDIYELTHLTKEQFYNLTESFDFAMINGTVGLNDIGNIIKFNYPIEKLLHYIVTQSRKQKENMEDFINMLSDYLNMCDILQVEADLYPQNLRKQHDDIALVFQKRKNMEYDSRLSLIGKECEEYVVPDEEELNGVGIPKLFQTMTVVFPQSERDFINEGNQQHNCVGSYPNRVRNGNCVIFFIRYKDKLDKSFITAECTRNGLGQCFYSNNRAVNDVDLCKFAKYIS